MLGLAVSYPNSIHSFLANALYYIVTISLGTCASALLYAAFTSIDNPAPPSVYIISSIFLVGSIYSLFTSIVMCMTYDKYLKNALFDAFTYSSTIYFYLGRITKYSIYSREFLLNLHFIRKRFYATLIMKDGFNLAGTAIIASIIKREDFPQASKLVRYASILSLLMIFSSLYKYQQLRNSLK